MGKCYKAQRAPTQSSGMNQRGGREVQEQGTHTHTHTHTHTADSLACIVDTNTHCKETIPQFKKNKCSLISTLQIFLLTFKERGSWEIIFVPITIAAQHITSKLSVVEEELFPCI